MERSEFIYGFPSLFYPEISLAEAVLRTCDRVPEKTAIIYAEPRFPCDLSESMSYGEFGETFLKLANSLESLGVKKGQHIACMLPNSPDFCAAIYALWSIGAVFIPINPMYKSEELKFVLQDSEAEGIIIHSLLYSLLDKIREELPKLKKVITVGTGVGENPDLKTLVLEGKVERKKIDIEPKEDLAAILYTGGTTGMPKGVMLTHYNLLSNAIQLMVASSFSHRDTILGSMPLFHSAEFGLFNITMISGATYVLMGRFDPALVAENIEKYGATFSWAVPPAFNALVYYLEDPKTRQYNWKNLKAFATGAWPVAPAMIERFKKIVAEKCNNPRVAHNQVWGMTEASPMCTTNPHLRLDKSYTQGIPLPDVELKLIDPETGKEIKEPNITGEAVLRGPNVFKGYWKRPEEDRNAWWIDPKTGLRYFRTGDLGYIDPEGFFVFQDRLKEVIKYKGYTIAPFELEALLLKHEAVKDVAVIGKPDPEAGEIPKAFVVLKPEYKNKITAKEIIEWCRERISGYKRIREVEFVEEIPRTPSGKILRRVLRELEKRKKD
jgi:long-chain acyl-CoA synthetase